VTNNGSRWWLHNRELVGRRYLPQTSNLFRHKEAGIRGPALGIIMGYRQETRIGLRKGASNFHGRSILGRYGTGWYLS